MVIAKADKEINNILVYTHVKDSMISFEGKCFKYIKTNITNSSLLELFLKKSLLQQFNPTNSRTNCVDVSFHILWFFITRKYPNFKSKTFNKKINDIDYDAFKEMFFNSFHNKYAITSTREDIANIFHLQNSFKSIYGLNYVDKNYRINMPYGSVFHMTTDPSYVFNKGKLSNNKSLIFSNPSHSFCGIYLEDGLFVIDGQAGHIYNFKTQKFIYYSSFLSKLNIKFIYKHNQAYNIFGVYDKDVTALK